MPFTPHGDIGIPFGDEAFGGAGGAGGPAGHGELVVVDDTADRIEQARFAVEPCALGRCGECPPRRVGAVRGVETIERWTAGEAMRELAVDLCETMKAGALCAPGGVASCPMTSAITLFPEGFARLRGAVIGRGFSPLRRRPGGGRCPPHPPAYFPRMKEDRA